VRKSRALRHNDVSNDACNDDEQSTYIVEVIVHQVKGIITEDEHQCAEHDEDDTQILFHSCMLIICCVYLFALQRYEEKLKVES